MKQLKDLTNSDMPAFPLTIEEVSPEGTRTQVPFMGLTKREYMALQILKSIVQSGKGGRHNISEAVYAADYLLESLENTGGR